MEITNNNWRLHTIQEMIDSGFKPESYLKESLKLMKGFKYYLGFGTLLGFYRDKDFILEDTDIDIVVLDPPNDEIMPLEKRFNDLGYRAIRTIKKFGKWQQVALQKDKMIVDLAFFRKEKDKYITYHEGGMFIDDLDITPLTTLETKYGVMPIPNNPEKYLEQHYGNWQVKSNDKSVKIKE